MVVAAGGSCSHRVLRDAFLEEGVSGLAASTLEKIESLRLRTAPFSSFYIERALNGSRTTDFLASVPFEQRHKMSAAVASRSLYLGESAEALSRLCDLWCDYRTKTFGNVSALWLEYDRVDIAVSSPSFCVCIIPDFKRWRKRTCTSRGLSVVNEVIEHVHGVDARAMRSIARVFDALAGCGEIIHLSLMVARESNPVKLYGVVPRREFMPFLRRAGWRGPPSVSQYMLDEFCSKERVGDEVYFDMTVDSLDRPGGNKLGVAFSAQHLEIAEESDPARPRLLDDLVASGLCSSAERAALRRWPARYSIARSRARPPLIVSRWLDVKLVWDPETEFSAKAYLGLAARRRLPFDPDGLGQQGSTSGNIQ